MTSHGGGWRRDKRSRHERGYGHRWVKLRDAILRRDKHLCQPCLRTDRATLASEVDHIAPKAKGGTDDPDNLQAICSACHIEKGKADNRRRPAIGADGWPTGPRRWGYSIPDGVRPSGIPVTLVCGPPASGKTSYVQHHASPADVVIDFDAICERVGGTKWETRREYLRAAFRARDEAIHALHDARQGRCYLIVTAPTDDERRMWVEALGNVTVHVMRAPEAECIARIRADPERAGASDRQIQVVRDWWAVN